MCDTKHLHPSFATPHICIHPLHVYEACHVCIRHNSCVTQTQLMCDTDITHVWHKICADILSFHPYRLGVCALQGGAVCCSVLHRVVQCVAVYYIVLCSVLQCITSCCICMHPCILSIHSARHDSYGVATISRLLKIIGLFCKRAL